MLLRSTAPLSNAPRQPTHLDHTHHALLTHQLPWEAFPQVAAADATIGASLSAGVITKITSLTGSIINPITASGTILAASVDAPSTPILASTHPAWIAPLMLRAPTFPFVATRLAAYVAPKATQTFYAAVEHVISAKIPLLRRAAVKFPAALPFGVRAPHCHPYPVHSPHCMLAVAAIALSPLSSYSHGGLHMWALPQIVAADAVFVLSFLVYSLAIPLGVAGFASLVAIRK